ncbi:TonB-dependent receptor plug domain-containing protein [Halorhodospira halochloris]|uniref:TonB-dependent receptor plug domain-containing protein n=1 Tax=Halorhodospira halochloris TaxID=1052 RepID=UPI001EE92B18|nr:TonB-dependent receptor [Halorhodospira halochloris]MCG5549418.1 TonB-dependent receptor [Halorhodospira halochloris]
MSAFAAQYSLPGFAVHGADDVAGANPIISKALGVKISRLRATFLCVALLSVPPISASNAEGNDAHQEEVQEMERVIVTGTLERLRYEEAPSGYSEISSEVIDLRPATTIDELLSELPGADIRRERGGSGVPKIRGLDREHTLVLIDGRRISNTDRLFPHSNFRMGQIPQAAIERIEVVRNPASSVYGADALGGAINIITRAPSDEWAGTLRGRLGSTDQSGGTEQNYSLFSAGPLGDAISGMVTIDVTDVEAIPNRDDEERDSTEAREALSGFASLRFKPGRGSHEGELFFSAVQEERHFNDVMDLDRDLFQYTAGLRHRFSAPDWDTQVDIYRNESSSEELNLKREDYYAEDSFEAKATYYWGPTQETTFAGDARRERYSRDRDGEEDISERSADHRGAVFEHRSYWLNEDWVTTLGLRLDGHSDYSSQSSARLSTVYRFSDHLRIKADYAEGYTAPDLRRSSADYVFTHPPSDGTVVRHGNPELSPEEVQSYSAGIEFEDRQRRAAATWFRNEITNLIEAGPVSGLADPPYDDEIYDRWEYQNISNAVTNGLELEAGYAWRNGHQIRGNYTYLQAFDEDRDVDLQRRPEQKFNLTADVVPWHGAKLNLRYQYTGEQIFGDNELPDYSLFHAAISQDIGERLNVQAGVENIADLQLQELDENFPFEHRGRFYYAAANWEW